MDKADWDAKRLKHARKNSCEAALDNDLCRPKVGSTPVVQRIRFTRKQGVERRKSTRTKTGWWLEGCGQDQGGDYVLTYIHVGPFVPLKLVRVRGEQGIEGTVLSVLLRHVMVARVTRSRLTQ